MSDLTTHLIAIGVGVLIAFIFFGGNNNSQTAEPAAASGAAPVKAAGKKKNKKKNKKKAAKPSEPASEPVKKAPAPAKAEAPKETPKEEAAPAPAPANGGKKKKNKKKNGAASNGTATNNNTSTKENKPPPAAPKPTPTKAPEPPAPAIVPLQPRVVVEEAWETIPKKGKKKKNVGVKKQQAAAAAATATAAAAAETKASVSVTIDASRIGIIIGPKGATMNAIQEKTGTKLDVNAPKPEEKAGGNQFRPVVGGKSKATAKATVVITEGSPEGQKAAKKAILELADRGYAALLQAEGFGESSVSVHPRFLSEIVGTGGKIIKAIQSELDVKLTIPKTDWTPKTMQIGNVEPKVRVGIAGDSPANVKQAKQVINDIVAYHHHPITHPGLIHQEVNVPQEFFHCIIGTRGSEIKHIRGNYKVEVYMPSSESWCTTENVICVGKSNDVEKAISYIKLLMDRDSELREQKYSDEAYGDDSYGW